MRSQVTNAAAAEFHDFIVRVKTALSADAQSRG